MHENNRVSISLTTAFNIIAFGFGNLAMLGWLATAAAPILIHLWMKHTHRDTRWAAMKFLQEAIKRNARRLKLQQWLLLAVRTLVLLLLALAAAKPYLSGWNLLTGRPKIHRVVVLDASMSMQYLAHDESLFDRAKRLAGEVFESDTSGAVYSICLMADPPQTIVDGPVAASRSAITQLAALEPTYGAVNLIDTLQMVHELLVAGGNDVSAREVFFFTDLAEHTWSSAFDGAAASSVISSLAEKATLTVVDVGPAVPRNVSVSNLRQAGTLATTAEPMQLECEVTNDSLMPAKNVEVQLVVGGVGVDEQNLSLAAGEQATLSFTTHLAEPGWQTLAVRLSGDQLNADDQAWLALDVRSRVRTLIVEGNPGAGRYLRHALDPGAEASPIEVVVVPDGALIETPLDGFQCVFLCNVAQFTDGERRLLERYASQGGNLVFFLGDRILPEAYNQVLAQRGGLRRNYTKSLLYTGETPVLGLAKNDSHAATPVPAMPLLPAAIGPLQSTTDFGLNPLDYRHPIAAAFRGSERAGLLSTPMSHYFQLKPVNGAEIAIALVNGDPFLVTAAYGRGMVAMVATSASLDTVDRATAQPWTMLPAWPSFLPIVREMVSYGLTSTREDWNIGPGVPIAGKLPANSIDTSLNVVRPDSRTDTIPVVRGDSSVEWSYASTDLPGPYTVMSAGARSLLATAAVNVPATESDLTRAVVDQLPEVLRVRAMDTGASSPAADLVAETAMHRWLLVAVLLLLLMEPIMAWAFAGRAA